MAIKQEIIELRDQELNDIRNSPYFSAEQRRKYIEMVTRAAEGTNGLTKEEKIQNISEITFGLATTMPRIAHYLNRNNVLTDELQQKVDKLETNISS